MNWFTACINASSHKPMPRRFSEQRGVKVRIADYGLTSSAPAYEPMYQALEAAGYARDHDIPASPATTPG